MQEDQGHTLTPLEAITVVLAEADDKMQLTRKMSELVEMTPEQRERIENVEVAISVVTAVLNTALPVARFRAFVQVDTTSKKKAIRDEYTICAQSINGILAGLIGLQHVRVDVHASLWEQKPMGAEMLTGYQGPTRGMRYRSWIESLLMWEEKPADVEAA